MLLPAALAPHSCSLPPSAPPADPLDTAAGLSTDLSQSLSMRRSHSMRLSGPLGSGQAHLKTVPEESPAAVAEAEGTAASSADCKDAASSQKLD